MLIMFGALFLSPKLDSLGQSIVRFPICNSAQFWRSTPGLLLSQPCPSLVIHLLLVLLEMNLGFYVKRPTGHVDLDAAKYSFWGRFIFKVGTSSLPWWALLNGRRGFGLVPRWTRRRRREKKMYSTYIHMNRHRFLCTRFNEPAVTLLQTFMKKIMFN